MKVLLDTHALLWMITDDEKLSDKAKNIFLDQDSQLFFSAASLWEMSIKISLGKLRLIPDWLNTVKRELTANSIRWLPIEITHCAAIEHLPFHHRDPFDRMLIAQAMTENMVLMSCDSHFSSYSIHCVW